MKKGTLIAVVVFALVTLGLYMAPVSPKQAPTAEAETEEAAQNTADQTEVNELDAKVNEAVKMIQNAEGAPMQGIALLREVLTEDPEHPGANYWLGEFSVMSGQWEKAAPRFETVLRGEPSNSAVALKLSQVYLQLNEIEKAKSTLQRFLDLNPDSDQRAEVETALNSI